MTKDKLIVVIGAYGSGKTEYSINLAREIHNEGKKVVLCDLDVVNPYFRSRDVLEQFEQFGIQVVAPGGEFRHADLPMVSPRVRGMILSLDKTVILDIGGDPAGVRALARFLPQIKNRGYELHFVLNTNRPFTADKPAITEMMDMLEKISKLKVTELICNTNLMEFTDEEVVKTGINIIQEVADEREVAFNKYLVLEKYDNIIPANLMNKEKIVLYHFMNKPWEKKFIYKGI